jgi:hypothetical protein
MPIGQTIPGVIPISSVVDLKQELELVIMGAQGALAGKPVRITVYDEVLFRHGEFKKEFERVFSVFNGFTQAQFVPEDFRFPIGKMGDGENGILLSIIVPVIKEVPATAGVQKKWAFGEPTETTEVRPARIGAEIDLLLRDVNNDRQTRGTIRLPFSALKKNRPLVIVVQNQLDHAIIFSTGWRKINGGANHFTKNGNGIPPSVNMASKDAALQPLVGGTGLGPGAPAIQASPPPLVDFTGIFEAFTNRNSRPGDAMPVMTVELNQAGNTVAGWVNPIRREVPTNPRFAGNGIPASKASIPPPPDLAPLKNDGFAVLFAHLNGDKMPFKWGFTGQFDDPEAKFVDDGAGELIGIGGDDLQADFTRNGETRTLFLRRVQPTPRWSNATMAAVIEHNSGDSRRLKLLYRGTQVQPLPIRFFNLMSEDLQAGGTLPFLITRQQTTANPDRQQARQDISNYLNSFIQADEYAEAVIANFTRAASTVELEIDVPADVFPLPGKGLPAGKHTKTIYGWLRFVVDEQLSELIQADPSLSPARAFTLVDPGFLAYGICPERGFLYKFVFDPLGADVPVGKLVKAGAYGLIITIKKFLLNDDGTVGAQVLTQGWTLAGKRMDGWFGDIGFALEANMKRGSASSIVQEVEFPSFHDLTPADINSGSFYTVTTGGPSVAFGAARILRGPSSAILVMTIHKDGFDGDVKQVVRMVAGIDQGFQAPDINRQMINKKNEFKFKLATLCMGWGIFSENVPPDIDPITQGTPADKSRTGKVARTTDAYFRRGGSNLGGVSLALFEEFLAVERALFVSGGFFASAEGHCSPEGPDNVGLAKRRAENVINAIKKAFGNRTADLRTEAIGRSDELAVLSGLPRPDAVTNSQTSAKYRELEASEFKEFRLVQLLVEGTVSVELKSEKVGIAEGITLQKPGN